MNKNLSSDISWECSPGIWTFGHKLDPIKEKKMDSKLKYHVVHYYGGTDSFETLDEAIKFARKQTMNTKEDTVIRQDVAVVRFPIPDYEVETLVPGTTV